MIAGFFTAWPVNVWLTGRGIKEAGDADPSLGLRARIDPGSFCAGGVPARGILRLGETVSAGAASRSDQLA